MDPLTALVSVHDRVIWAFIILIATNAVCRFILETKLDTVVKRFGRKKGAMLLISIMFVDATVVTLCLCVILGIL